MCRRARVGHVKLKDLRDTFASQLLTCGVPIGWISLQLGHAEVDITSKRYARWCGGLDYREPMARRAGEVPTDFLARIGEQSPHKVPTDSETTRGGNEKSNYFR